MTVTDAQAATIGRRIWQERLQEGLVVGLFARLRAERFLERHAPGAVAEAARIWEEEATHGRWFEACARRYLPVRPAGAALPVARWPLHEMLWYMHLVERISRGAFRLNVALHERVTGDREAAAMYRAIMADEVRHVAWGRGVLAALRRDPAMRADFARLNRQHLVPTLYRAAFGTRSWYRDEFGLDDPAPDWRFPDAH